MDLAGYSDQLQSILLIKYLRFPARKMLKGVENWGNNRIVDASIGSL
jgi:hypothetical protein